MMQAHPFFVAYLCEYPLLYYKPDYRLRFPLYPPPTSKGKYISKPHSV